MFGTGLAGLGTFSAKKSAKREIFFLNKKEIKKVYLIEPLIFNV